MENPNRSPAVQSMRKEQAEQKKQSGKDDLDKALENTFPASDPVSATQAAVPGKMAAKDPDASDEDFALVDEALHSTGEHAGEAKRDRGELHALKHDAGRAAASISELASGSARVARNEAQSFMENLEERIRAKPISAVAIVAALAFVFGATR